jgi:hypothetical protein
MSTSPPDPTGGEQMPRPDIHQQARDYAAQRGITLEAAYAELGRRGGRLSHRRRTRAVERPKRYAWMERKDICG